MTSRDFCYWLQGYFEVADTNKPHIDGLNAEQVKTVRNHLSMVFKHEIDPSFPASQQAELNAIHSGKPPKIGGVTDDGKIMRC